jgi:hypothetical protein
MIKVSGLIIQKADRQEVHDMILGKANKVDTEMSLRWVDLLHKMVNQIMVLLSMKFKNSLE